MHIIRQIRVLEMGVDGDPPLAETRRGEGSPNGLRNPSFRGSLSYNPQL